MNFADMPLTDPLPRYRLEQIALMLARSERDLRDLSYSIGKQQESLAELRTLLLAVLWPRRELSKET